MTPAAIKSLPMAVGDALLGCYRVLARDADGDARSGATATARLQLGMAETCDAKPGEGIKGVLLFSASIAAGTQPTIADAAAALAAASEAGATVPGVEAGSVTLTTTTVMWDDSSDASDARRLPMRFEFARWLHAFTAMHLLKAPTDDLAAEAVAEEELRRRYAAFEREMAARSTLHLQAAAVEADEASQKAPLAAAGGASW